MRVLILSSSTGAGHDSCANAIKEAYDNNGDFCEVYEIFHFISNFATAVMTKGHTAIYRHFPAAFKIGYNHMEKHFDSYNKPKGSLTNRFLALGAKKLNEYVKNENFDTVICTHPFSTVMLAAAVSKYGLNVKTAFVATDYTCAPTVNTSGIDTYFIADSKIIDLFVKYGMEKNKLVPVGIPVRQMFYKNLAKEEAKEKSGIKKESTHLLVMCGSMGCGPVKKILKHISAKIPTNTEITIVCGTNKRLAKSLNRKYKANDFIHVQGFVKNMSELLDSADLYLTKPGGLSVSEARQKNLPMVFIDAVAGCEEYNRKFFVDLGGAVSGESVKELEEKCLELLNNKEKIQKMSERLAKLEKINASEAIRTALTE